MRFEPVDATEPWAKAELAVKVHALDDPQPVTLAVHGLDDAAWDEKAVTWATQPPLGSDMALATATARKAEQTLTFDVTAHVNRQRERGQPVSLVLLADGPRQVTLQGREFSGSAAPTLRLWTQAAVDARAALPPPPDPKAAIARYEQSHEALYFKGSGRGGRESRERLIVEDCTFIMDFQQGNFDAWDALRSAIYVEGYREVIVRRCTFVSKGRHDDPPRKTNASVTAYDYINVLVEDCTFEGKTNWMRGHVLVFCCGPTTIRRVEVKGQLQQATDKNGKTRDVWACGGGLWVANGLGEGKIGTIHANDPDLMIYPSGPLVIEDCHIHDQTGRDNTDGIYVQSIHPFVIRNSRVENWKMDSLLDLGFRDSLGKAHGNAKLANHGAMGLVEGCTFAGGFIKVSVGAGGGIVMRDNTLKDVWLMPYAFDGGHWYILGNRFENVTGPLVSGRDGRTDGWAPKEGMFMRGGQLVWRHNTLTFARDTPPAKLVVPNPNGPHDYPPVNSDDPRLGEADTHDALIRLPPSLRPAH